MAEFFPSFQAKNVYAPKSMRNDGYYLVYSSDHHNVCMNEMICNSLVCCIVR